MKSNLRPFVSVTYLGKSEFEPVYCAKLVITGLGSGDVSWEDITSRSRKLEDMITKWLKEQEENKK